MARSTVKEAEEKRAELMGFLSLGDNWTQVESSNIKEVTWKCWSDDPKRPSLYGDLFIRFKNDKVYMYSGIQKAMFDSFLRAESKGKFANQHFIGKVAETRVDGI